MNKSEPRRKVPRRGRNLVGSLGLLVDSHDVRRLFPFLILNGLEFDDLTFRERSESVALDRRVMNEELLAGFLADEPVPFRLVEPLDRAAVSQFSGPSFSALVRLEFDFLRGADPPSGPDRLEAIPAIDGLARGRLEGNLGRDPARRAYRFVELARG